MVAALTAAHQGLSTVVVEKAPHYGGSTARSGGGVWIPNNEILKRDGVTDTAEAARTYLHAIIGDVVPAEKIDTYLERGPEMLSFVLKNSPLKLCWVPGYSTTTPRHRAAGPPAARSSRSRSTPRSSAPTRRGLEPPYGKVPLNMVVMQQDYVRLNQLKRHPRGVLRSLKVGVRSVSGQRHRQEPGRHGPRADRAAAHRPAEGGRAGPAEHRAHRPATSRTASSAASTCATRRRPESR